MRRSNPVERSRELARPNRRQCVSATTWQGRDGPLRCVSEKLELFEELVANGNLGRGSHLGEVVPIVLIEIIHLARLHLQQFHLVKTRPKPKQVRVHGALLLLTASVPALPISKQGSGRLRAEAQLHRRKGPAAHSVFL